jgi:hypothetical protein
VERHRRVTPRAQPGDVNVVAPNSMAADATAV